MIAQTRRRPQTLRYRSTVQHLNEFLAEAAADTAGDIASQFQDAYDARLGGLNLEMDFPAASMPAWMGFKARYVSDVTGGLVTPSAGEDEFELLRDMYQMACEIRDLVEAETVRQELSDW